MTRRTVVLARIGARKEASAISGCAAMPRGFKLLI
jgi:hypothetical protein